MKSLKTNLTTFCLTLITAVVFSMTQGFSAEKQTSTQFHGAKANTGTVTLWKDGSKTMLTFSDDFVTPETPDPHVQVVDKKGNIYLLNRCMIKAGEDGSNKFSKTVQVPAYIKDVAKVQIWCAWAEALLGEAEFESPAKMSSRY